MSSSSPADPSCPVCGGGLSSDAPGGWCTQCLHDRIFGGWNGGAPASPLEEGAEIGPYLLLERVGEGGFGVVYRAVQSEPIRREVALKLIKPGMDSVAIVRRFEAERKALAMMEHPNIAAVLDAATSPDGHPYFAMELVRGRTITAYCEVNKLSLPQRLELFLPVCHAIQHAHQKAVLHRDLKPSNILVTDVDGLPQPKVIDFGIAKALEGDADLACTHFHTMAGGVVGTLEYMSPEQAGAKPDLDTRSDIYALGAILYELLTGSPPLRPELLRRAAIDERLRMVRETVPERPSSLLTAGETSPRPSKDLQADLDWIVLKALEKERERRYESAAALAADISRFLKNEPVLARPPDLAYRLRKFVARNRLAAGSAALVALSLVGATGISLWQTGKALRAEAETKKALHSAETNLAKAHLAVDRYLTGVSGNNKLKEAEFQELRKELLETAIPFYDGFLQEKAGDPMLLWEQATALLRLGGIREELGEFDMADADIIRAQGMLAALAKSHPGEPKYRNQLGATYTTQGRLYDKLDRRQEQLTAFQASLDIKRALTKDYPDNSEYRDGLILSLSNLASSHFIHGRVKEAEPILREAIALDTPETQAMLEGDPQIASSLALSYMNFACVQMMQGQLADGEASSRRGLALLEIVAAKDPAKHAYSREVCGALSILGNVLLRQDRRAEAEEVYRREIVEAEAWAAAFPSLHECQVILARAYFDLGDCLRLGVISHDESSAEAETTLGKGVEIMEDLTSHRPEVAARYGGELENFRNRWNTLRDVWWKSAVKAGRHDEVAAAMETRLKDEFGSFRGLVHAARIAASCAWTAKDAPGLAEAERAGLSDAYARRAVQFLSRAADDGHGSFNRWKRDAAFDLLHDREDFKLLHGKGGCPPPAAGPSGALSGKPWRAAFFTWGTDTDPCCADPFRWRALAEGKEAAVTDLGGLDLNFGNDGPQGIVPGLPDTTRLYPEFFGMVARATLHLQGRWQITLEVDDGARVWINGKLAIDEWGYGVGREVIIWDFPPGSPSEVCVEYFEIDGAARLKLAIDKVDP